MPPVHALAQSAVPSLGMPDVAWQYLPILLFIGVGIAFSLIFVGAPVLVSKLTGTSRPDANKLSEYESGFPAFSDSRAQFDVRFYLVSILFIVFDLEAAYLFPWAVSLHWTGVPGWLAMMQFLAELAIGLIYAWKIGALEWE
jgi:NADH-quinone oxidoreductase subunit A